MSHQLFVLFFEMHYACHHCMNTNSEIQKHGVPAKSVGSSKFSHHTNWPFDVKELIGIRDNDLYLYSNINRCKILIL